MTELEVSDNGLQPASLRAYDVQPYVPDGGYTVGALMMLTGVLGFAGIVMGSVASWISQYFYLIILFPIAIGFCVGLAGVFGIKKFKIRKPILCGVAGFLGGIFAMLAMHYGDYSRFKKDLSAAIPPQMQLFIRNLDQIKAKAAEQPEEVRQMIQGMEADPEFPEIRKLVNIDSLWKHIDYKAEQGVELKGKGKQAANIGYTGSYIYWGIEVFVVAAVAFGIMKSSAQDPFCAECGTWKNEQEFPALGGTSSDLAAAVSEGDLPRAYESATGQNGDGMLVMWICPNCEQDAPVDVGIRALSTNNEGKLEKKDLCRTTYPADAFEDLQTLSKAQPRPPVTEFQPDSVEPDSVVEEQV